MPHHNQRKWQENGERKANIVCRNEQVVYLDEVFYYLICFQSAVAARIKILAIRF